jgi:leucyl aminopeptidase
MILPFAPLLGLWAALQAPCPPPCPPPCLLPTDGPPRQPQQQAQILPLLPNLRSEALRETVQALCGWPNRYYDGPNGRQAAHYLYQRMQGIGAHRPDIDVRLVDHGFAQPSVIATLRGEGPWAEERIVLGAHLDSINDSGLGPVAFRRAPGADDDASGIAVLLEIFRVLVEAGYRPARTLEFMAYAGEEVGQLGSRQIAQAYTDQHIRVGAVLQLDMTMHSADGSQAIYLIRDLVDPALTDFVGRLATQVLGFEVRSTRCGYTCSDHASWTAAGYPSAFPFESSFRGINPRMHTAQDTLEHGLDVEFGRQFAELGLAFAVELSALPPPDAGAATGGRSSD